MSKPIDTLDGHYIEGWCQFKKGNIDNDCVCLGMVYGVNFIACEQILETITDSIETLEGVDFEKNGECSFKITNISYEEGQMTFPETGQWDFPPYWEYGIELLSVKYYTDEETGDK